MKKKRKFVDKVQALKEWSWIFVDSVGASYDLYSKGIPHTVETYSSAKPFFYWADDFTIVESCKGIRSGDEELFNKKYSVIKENDWSAPEYKKHYLKKLEKYPNLKSEKPVIVINNKYNGEWGQKIPYNYLPLDFLKYFIKLFHKDYQIYYIRHTGAENTYNKGYLDDAGSYDNIEPYGDYDLIHGKYPSVITIYDILKQDFAKGLDYNELQMMLLSQSKYIISVNGGNAILSAYFGEELMIYGHPNCKSTKRRVWRSDSWLKELNDTKIIGCVDSAKMLGECILRWL